MNTKDEIKKQLINLHTDGISILEQEAVRDNRVVQKPQFLNNFPEKIENLPPSAANSAGLGREPQGS